MKQSVKLLVFKILSLVIYNSFFTAIANAETTRNILENALINIESGVYAVVIPTQSSSEDIINICGEKTEIRKINNSVLIDGKTLINNSELSWNNFDSSDPNLKGLNATSKGKTDSANYNIINFENETQITETLIYGNQDLKVPDQKTTHYFKKGTYSIRLDRYTDCHYKKVSEVPPQTPELYRTNNSPDITKAIHKELNKIK